MALVPKLPDIGANPSATERTLFIFDAVNSMRAKRSQKHQLFPHCTEHVNQNIRYPVKEPIEKPFVNLKSLEWLIDVDKKYTDRDEAHEVFMKNYHRIFQKDEIKPEANQKNSKNLSVKFATRGREKAASQLAIANEEAAKKAAGDDADGSKKQLSEHDVKLHIERIHQKSFDEVDPEIKRLQSFKRLRKIVRKFPFERNDEENREIFQILNTLEEFRELFPPNIREDQHMLEKLCAYAQLESVLSKNTPVFGNFGFYVVLKGAVKPLSVPHLNKHLMKLRIVTPEPDDPQTLGIGSCFGTVSELKQREMTTRMFRVMTLEDKCEFLLISIESYNRIIEKITEEERLEKMIAIKSCPAYTTWPKHTVEELMQLFEWRQFSGNTILCSEGYRCPFIGFIKEGVCHVLRKVDVPYMDRKTKKREKRMKQVVIGKLKENDSFGEISVAMREPMTCSIVTETPCRIGTIPYDKINKLDEITLRLLIQTCSRTFGSMSQDQIHKQYIEQEKKKEWKVFKNRVINTVIKRNGIEYGKGKYITANEADGVSNVAPTEEKK